MDRKDQLLLDVLDTIRNHVHGGYIIQHPLIALRAAVANEGSPMPIEGWVSVQGMADAESICCTYGRGATYLCGAKAKWRTAADAACETHYQSMGVEVER